MKSKKKIILYILLGVVTVLFALLCVWALDALVKNYEKSKINESGVHHLGQWLCENGDVYASEFCIEKTVENEYEIKISHKPNTLYVSVTYTEYAESEEDSTVTELDLWSHTEDVSYTSYNEGFTYKLCGNIDSTIYTHNYPILYNENSRLSRSDLKNEKDLIEKTRLLINKTIDKANELLAEKNTNLTMQDVCFKKF